MESAKSLPPKRGRLACTECRQQKAKCDAHLHPDRPCTRCIKVKAQCVLSGRFRRENKRQRLSDLQQETNDLRRRLKSSQSSTNPHPSPISMLTAAAELGASPANSEPTTLQMSPVSPYPQPMLSRVCSSPEEPRAELASSGEQAADITLTRTLNGVEVTGFEIDEIFQLYFDYYAQFLDILTPGITPNSYYNQSPLLFWAIIGVACRNYPRNPTLLTALARSISEMALLAIVTTSVPWHAIKSLLLLLTWPLPREETKPDITFPLSGMLLHIAMQNGLHIPMSSHEFSRVRIPAPSETDMIRRSELWAHCIIVYQRACTAKGQCPRPLVNSGYDAGQGQVPFQRIAPSLMLKVKCQEIIAQCSAAVIENGVRNMSLDQERALDILLRTFENQVNDLDAQAVTENDHANTMHCRLCVQVFHFYKTRTLFSTGCLPRVLSTACAIIELAENLGEKLNSLSAAPLHILCGTLVALEALLRILKSSASCGLDTERAKLCFFKGINLSKQLSVVSHDAAAKMVTIMTQLWHSSKAFRRPDGSEYVTLRIRSRLVLSPLLDTVGWWRDEFDIQHRATAMPQESATDAGVESRRDAGGLAAHAPLRPVERHEPLLFDDQFLADFEWALGSDGLFPPTEPFGPTWPTGSLL